MIRIEIDLLNPAKTKRSIDWVNECMPAENPNWEARINKDINQLDELVGSLVF